MGGGGRGVCGEVRRRGGTTGRTEEQEIERSDKL